MPDCRYCEESFADEDAYHEHLRAIHADELGRIDRRRVGLDATTDGEESPFSLPVVVGGVLGILVVALVVWVAFFAGSNGGSAAADAEIQPTNHGEVHYHGTIHVSILGEELDFTEDRFTYQDDAFHFHGEDPNFWHGHAERVTVEYALATLGIEVDEKSVAFEGETYVDGEGYDVSVTVNGDPVDPASYTIEDGDEIEVSVEEA